MRKTAGEQSVRPLGGAPGGTETLRVRRQHAAGLRLRKRDRPDGITGPSNVGVEVDCGGGERNAWGGWTSGFFLISLIKTLPACWFDGAPPSGQGQHSRYHIHLT